MNGIKKCLIEYDNCGGISSNIELESITIDTCIEEFEFDSVDKLEFAMLLEEYYNIKIYDSDVDNWQTLNDIVNYIAKFKNNTRYDIFISDIDSLVEAIYNIKHNCNWLKNSKDEELKIIKKWLLQKVN